MILTRLLFSLFHVRKLAVTVREVVEEERERKIKEREEWKQIRDYHETILRKGTLDDINLPRSATHGTIENDVIRTGMLFTPNDSHSQQRSQRVNKTPLSLCVPLGSSGSKAKIQEKKHIRAKKKRKR